ncbi:MAG: 50S ribosomal protein L30 [Candidatus Micrarchaeota archaeon]|nr:50S ribosomal protein L30 [Candidatus Micrarchaeota archaeon]
MFAVIKIRGTVTARGEIIDTLRMLRLHRKHHCVLVPDNPSFRGMLQKAKDYITWGEINDEILKELIRKRGRKPGDRRLSPEEADAVFKAVKSDGPAVLKKMGIKPVFRLTPPSGGFKKSIKQHFPKGELGYRGEKINELLERMI